jgi:DNA-binding response OmpR family regulator
MANSTTIPRESMSADSTAAGSRSVAIYRITSSTRPVKRSITPSPRTLRTEAPAAAALPANLSGLEGVIHSLLLSAFEKIVDRMYRTSLRSDDQSRRPLAIAETDSSIESPVRSPAEPRETMLRVGSLELDLINRTAKRGDRPIDLLPSEFRLLKYMMQRGGQLLTRAKLFQEVWHYKFLPETNLVDVHMGRLRRKLNGPNDAPMIRTVRGAGFILSATP